MHNMDNTDRLAMFTCISIEYKTRDFLKSGIQSIVHFHRNLNAHLNDVHVSPSAVMKEIFPGSNPTSGKNRIHSRILYVPATT